MFYKKLLVVFLVLGNLFALGVIYSNYQKQRSVDIQTKLFTSDFTSKALIADFINVIKQENTNRSLSFGIISPASKNCFIDSVTGELKEKQKLGETAIIYLPNTYSEQDLNNFKKNLNVDFELKLMSAEISDSWVEVLNDKKLSGVLVSIKGGEIKIR